jgi:hypothetical protein
VRCSEVRAKRAWKEIEKEGERVRVIMFELKWREN